MAASTRLQVAAAWLLLAAMAIGAHAAQLLVEKCPFSMSPTEADRPKASEQFVFDELSGEEITAVRRFLEAQPELGIVRLRDAAPTDNIVHTIEMLPPPKQAVLDYLDRNGTKPERRAYAMLLLYNMEQGGDGSRCMQVEVGPLPTPTYYKELRPRKQAHPISILSRPISLPEYDGYEALIVPMMTEIEDVLSTATGGWKYNDCGDKCIAWTDGAPRGTTQAGRKQWVWFLRSIDGMYIHHLGLEVYIDSSSSNSSEWFIDKLFFANKLWNSTAEMVQWYKDSGNDTPGYKLYDPPASDPWSTFRVRDKNTPLGAKQGAQMYEPAGKRYTVDGKRVEWQGWSFHIGLRTTAGLRLWDVRYRGERIAYELSVQQAFAAYGGNPETSGTQGGTMYLDHAWGMGSSHYELIHGSDCPQHSVYFDFWHFWSVDKPVKNLNSVCLFEQDLGYTVRRHRSVGGWAASIKGYALVVRGISTVYNYDYTFDFMFYTDGTFEARVTPFGYVQGMTYTLPSDANFGYPFYYNASGTIHNHMTNWKVDLDIAGTSNSIKRTAIAPVKIDTAWHPTYKTMNSLHFVNSFLETEDQGSLLVDMHKPTLTVVVNENARNTYGSQRGYKIDHSRYIYNIQPEDTYWLPGAAWTTTHTVFSVQKDDELTSGTIFDQATPATPVLNLLDYLDGESLRNTDVVAWVSSGLWHVPVAEDGPTSSGISHYSGFVLRPFNFFDHDVAMDTRDIVMYRGDKRVPSMQQPRTSTKGGSSCLPRTPQVPYAYEP